VATAPTRERNAREALVIPGEGASRLADLEAMEDGGLTMMFLGASDDEDCFLHLTVPSCSAVHVVTVKCFAMVTMSDVTSRRIFLSRRRKKKG
jgi:hypothetical protein